MRRAIVFTVAMCWAALGQGQEIRHRFLVADFMHQSVHYVDQTDAAKNWTLVLPEMAFDLQLIGQNRLLCNRSKGYDVYDLATREKVDSCLSETIGDVRSVRQLADGRTFWGSEGGTVHEYDAQKKLTASYAMPKALKYVRLIRFTPQGTLLLSAEDGVYEVSLKPGLEAESRLLRKVALPRGRNAYMSLYTPDGTLAVAGGYSKVFYRFDAQGKVLNETVLQQPEGLNNYFYAGFQFLKNGHLVMSNWTGHNKDDFKPGWKVVELDPSGQVVWTWNEEYGGTVNQVLVLDELDTTVLNDDIHGVLGPVK